MTESNKWITLISKLLEATQKNEIKWTLTSPPGGLSQRGEKARQAYETEFLGKRFRIFEYRYLWQPDPSSPLWRGEKSEWVEQTRLEFIDDEGRSLYEVPNVEGIDHLLEAAKYQTAEIDKFLEKLVT